MGKSRMTRLVRKMCCHLRRINKQELALHGTGHRASPEADKAKKPDEHHPDAGSRWKEVLRRTGGFSFKDKDKPGNPGKAPAAPAKPTKKEGEAQTHVETFAALNPIKSLLSDMCALGDFTYAEVSCPQLPPLSLSLLRSFLR
eukprot:1066392-Rhodomonas_salina.1